MKRFITITLIISLALFAGCSSATGKLAKIQKKGEMVVYTDPNFPPFEFQGAGGIMGVDIEIGKAIAAELGVKVTFQETKFDSIIMAIKGGKGDIAISGMTIREDRLENIDFSVPYIESVQYLILPVDSTIELMEDLVGKTVGVAMGYTGQFLIEDEMDPELEGVLVGGNTTVREYNSAMEAAQDLNIGRIDAVVMDEYVAKIIAASLGLNAIPLRYESGELAAEEYGVVVAKGNEDLLAIINKVIRQLYSQDKIKDWMIEFTE
jgi:polar amino acid transport system substrate-binding protein